MKPYKKSFVEHLIYIFLFYSFLGLAINQSFIPLAQAQTSTQATTDQTSDQVKEAEQKARDIVWKISNRPGYWGTAFAIAPNLFITNFHVIEGLFLDSDFNSVPDITLSHSSGKSLSFKKIIKVSARMDLALIETHEETNHYLTIPVQGDFEDPLSDELFIIAYPDKGQLTKIKQIGQVKKFPYKYMFATNQSILEGSSGSPVFNKYGQLVGVVFSAVANIVALIKIQHVSEFIHQSLNSLDCSTINLKTCIQQEVANLHLLAEASDIQAQLKLGSMYDYAYTVQKDDVASFYWTEQAAKQGDASAQYFLAKRYEIQKNDEMYFYWLEQVAKQGFVPAQYVFKHLLFTQEEETSYPAYHGDTPLHHATRNGQISQVKNLMTSGIDPNLKDGVGDTALHDATANGHKDIVEFLIARGANPKSQNDYRELPLHYMAQYGQKSVADILLSGAKTLNQKDRSGNTPLHNATYNGHKDIVKILIASGAKLYLKNLQGLTALHLAAKNGHKDTVEVLIASGAKLHLKDDKLNTALHLAAKNGHKDTVEVLIASGADLNLKNDTHDTALHLVAQNGHKDIVEILIVSGANYFTDHIYNTALLDATENGHKDIVKILIANGADPKSHNVFGWRPLHYAAQNGYQDIVKILITNGVDPNAKNISKNTALHLATKNGHQDTVEFLIVNGADLNIRNKHGWTALHFVAQHGDQDIAEMLITSGIDPYIKTSYPPRTALRIAIEFEQESFVQFLHSKGILY